MGTTPLTISQHTEYYRQDLAFELGKLVQQAYDMYHKYKRGKDWQNIVIPGYEQVFTFDAQPMCGDRKPFGFITTKDNNIYIVFRGTSTSGEWYSDIDARQVNFKSTWGKVHLGFNNIFDSCSSAVTSYINQYSDIKNRNVYITGHSLGGAVATLCAAHLLYEIFEAPTVYTFASPRVGDSDFRTSFNERVPLHFRIFNTEDTVPIIPPAVSSIALGGFYEHCGIPLAFTINYGAFTENHSIGNYMMHL
jgi:triacylglycerol lipase